MARQNTRIQAEGAEFLVLGQLLIAGIPPYKAYTNMPGYDVVATTTDGRASATISVKSRWRTNAEGFLIKNFDCDFVVIVKLNRGSKDGLAEVRSPEFFVMPVAVAKSLPRTEDWGRVSFKSIVDIERYRDGWESIREHLHMPRGFSGAETI